MTHAPRTALGLVVAGLAVATAARALPQRSLVARPLPPGVLAAAEAGVGAAALDAAAARSLTDSLLAAVSAVRGLKPLRPVPVQAASRAAVRARLEEITRQDAIETTLRQEQERLAYLGLVPADLDLVKLYHDLLEEQLAGFYDIDRRELVLAEWLPRDLLGVVLDHELAHALQDQHFSLRVRKRLGFESTDAETAWHALVEGDATALMAEMALAPLGKHFTDLADTAVALAPPAARAAAGGLDSERFRAAPRAVREDLGFPYVQGLRFVQALYRQGGWAAVDAAYVHPPASTEQVLHAERPDNLKDLPVRITVPDLRGMLGAAYRPVATGTLGEHDLGLYLEQYVDPEVAQVAADGWAGCAYALYRGSAAEVPAFVLVSTWDSEDDAVEFFGGLIGALEARFPNQKGDAEISSQDLVQWNQDENAHRVNVLRLRERQVVCLEGMPGPRLARILGKLDTGLRLDDPSPEVRARTKDNLPWNRKMAAVGSGALVPRLDVPQAWTRVEVPTDSLAVLEARRGDTRLEVVVERAASRELGLDGYAHAVAARLQGRGKDVYVLTDVDFPREGGKFYQHVFTQTEGTQKMAYYLGAVDLGQGLGYLLVTGPSEGDDAALEAAFYDLLGKMELLPAVAPSGHAGAAPGGASPRQN